MNRIVSWLRDCLAEDRAHSGVTNFYASRVKHRRFIKNKEELAWGRYEEIVLPPKYSEKLLRDVQLYQREKELIYGYLFLCGREGKQTWSAPLLIYPGTLEQSTNDYFPFRIDRQRCRLNQAIVQKVQDKERLLSIFANLENDEGQVGYGVFSDLVYLFRDEGVFVSDEDRLLLGNLTNSSKIQKLAKKKQLSLVGAAAFGLVEKSRGVAGVLKELDFLGESESYSEPLKCFLSGVHCKPNNFKKLDWTNLPYLPHFLSDAQMQILSASRSSKITVCHGPPGTGKTFTVASVASDHLQRGQSVLISSKTDNALNVIEEVVNSSDLLCASYVRGGRRQYLAKLKKFFEQFFYGGDSNNFYNYADSTLQRLNRFMEGCMLKEEKLIKAQKEAVKEGEFLEDHRKLFHGLRLKFLKWSSSKRPLLMDSQKELLGLHVERQGLIKRNLNFRRKYLRMQYVRDKVVRQEMVNILSALRKRRSSEQEEAFSKVNFDVLTRVVPLWMATLDDLHRMMPMEKELFDVGIIDEGSQCDLASLLPFLQRVKRVVIAGDPQQLRHLSFLTYERMQSFSKRYKVKDDELDYFHYAKRSAVDVAIDISYREYSVGFLDEHFRSKGDLMSFNNEEFYNGRLRKMKHRPWIDVPVLPEIIDCNGATDEDGVNTLEVGYLINYLREFLGDSSNLDLGRTIGILSPFRNQVEAIRKVLVAELTKEQFAQLFSVHQCLIGTAYAFQGTERDVMLISMTVGPASASGMKRYLDREDVFNVSLSRAKDQMLVFSSVALTDLHESSLLRKFMQHALTCESVHTEKWTTGVSELVQVLEGNKFDVRYGELLAGVEVDVLVGKNDKWIALDLIGFLDDTHEPMSRSETFILHRVGVDVYPISLTEWTYKRQQCIDSLNTVLSS